MEKEEMKFGIVAKDPWLEPVEQEVKGRYNRYATRLAEITKAAGSLLKFADAYKHMGITYDKKRKGWFYREWAPRAHALFLIGDFNGWNRASHPLSRRDDGVWEIFLDEETYKDTFTHGSLIKVVVTGNNGTRDRIPAYINRVVQDDNTKNYTAQVWLPEKFNWRGDNFSIKKLENLYIYESHVGMAQEKEAVGTYKEFEETILPYVKQAGYNAIQLMAIAEHPYYGSFGYHVSNFFAPSSRFGTPEELKSLIKTAHKMGIAVIMDIVHSHTVKNVNEGINELDGSPEQYFHSGGRGEHPDWDSKLFNYGKWEVMQFLLSNVKYWIEEFHFDGYRFDGVSSMMYFHHGHTTFDSPWKYYSEGVEWDSITYLQLANKLMHSLDRAAISIAEDVSGMPGLTFDPEEGGLGFDYRLAMGIPDYWIKLLKEKRDDDWSVGELWSTLTNRNVAVNTIAYAESHDQALVGDKTIAFRLMDKEMYWNMHKHSTSFEVDRGIALHKLIRFVTISLGGTAYLAFMGNEFGHPEWIDFPREGNGWSHKYARRQWSLVKNTELKYHYLGDFDREMLQLMQKYSVFKWEFADQLHLDEWHKTMVFKRANIVFVFNFHLNISPTDYEIPVPEAGLYKIVLNSDSHRFGGFGRIDENVQYMSYQKPEDDRHFIRIYNTNRTALALVKVE